jgi:hypothetical protein
VKALLTKHLDPWFAQLPGVFAPLDATGALAVGDPEGAGDGLGWTLTASVEGQLPGIGRMNGDWSAWICWSSVLRLRDALRALLREQGEVGAPTAPEGPFAPRSPSGLPCALEGIAEVVEEVARMRRGDGVPFRDRARRVRVARLAERFAHEAIPLGLRRLSLDGSARGSVRVLLDGDFVEQLHPRVELELQLPAGDHPALCLRAAGGALARWGDIAQAFALFNRVLRAIREQGPPAEASGA